MAAQDWIGWRRKIGLSGASLSLPYVPLDLMRKKWLSLSLPYVPLDSMRKKWHQFVSALCSSGLNED
jgi:hypothetical protein